MNSISFKNLYFSSLVYYLLSLRLASIHAATFNVRNNCSYTVWAAAKPGGGKELKHGQEWVINTNHYTGRIWARTNYKFDANGIGKCETGDCNGTLHCVSEGTRPCTLAEYSFPRNQSNNLDFFDISSLDGFNVPMEFRGTSSECTKEVIKCTADINASASNCNPTAYSKSLKDLCPDVYTYPADHATSEFTCPNGIDYKVVFCPN
ncbi:hypothetical protein Q3G72_015390 [Acer saccharum]|nr:hypothetical protein Q3G72_015390 [Acer saccharum]